MVIDTSAILAVLLGESEAELLARAISNEPQRLMSAFSVLEASIVIEAKKGEVGGQQLDLLLHRAQIDIVSLTAEQTDIARRAWRRYGKGRHPAKLNIGDCCAYALSRVSGQPLLFKGEDFGLTDVDVVSY